MIVARLTARWSMIRWIADWVRLGRCTTGCGEGGVKPAAGCCGCGGGLAGGGGPGAGLGRGGGGGPGGGARSAAGAEEVPQLVAERPRPPRRERTGSEPSAPRRQEERCRR